MTTEPITVRRARIGDQPQLALLGAALDARHLEARPDLFHRPDSPARGVAWAAGLAGPDAAAFIAESDSGPLGFALVRRRQPEAATFAATRPYAELEEIAVAPACRDANVRRALVEAARGWAQAQGLGRLVAQAFAFDSEALGFYEAAGFSEMTRRMEMTLGPAASDQAPWT